MFTLVFLNQQINLRLKTSSSNPAVFPQRSMQNLVRNLPAAIFEYAFYPHGESKFLYISERVIDIFGLSSDELTKDASLINSVILGGDPGVFSDPALRIPGNEVVVKVRSQEFPKDVRISYTDEVDNNGVVVRRGLAQIVTSTQGVGSFEELFDRILIGIVIHRDGVIVFANKHAHLMAGASPGQLIGIDPMTLVHPDNRGVIRERVKQVYSGQAVPMIEEKFARLDGRIVDVETAAFPFMYNGKLAVQVVFRDITEKKNVEAQIRKNETLFRQLFHNVPMAVVMLDENGKVSEINPGFEQMFGFSSEELRGNNLNEFIVPENLWSEGIDLNNLITSNKAVSIESIRRHKSGRLVNVLLCGVPVIFDNQAIGIFGVYVDITDRKKVEEELKIRNAELDNFVYKVSHDLRAPLSSVLGLVNLSRLQGNNDNPQEYLELIGEKIQALDHFISDVLSHSKNLKMEVEIGRVDLEQIIAQTFLDLSYLKGARETKRSVTITGTEFFSDQWRVSEIFRNLISNAIKYRRPDAQDSEIMIRIDIDHLRANIVFSDNGIGIKESSLKRVFEMFYRATEQGEGSGIGLYIVKNAVEKLGGHISVASKVNEGTTFHIVLPNRIGTSINTSKIRKDENS